MPYPVAIRPAPRPYSAFAKSTRFGYSAVRRNKNSVPGKINICFIYHYQSIKIVQDRFHFMAVKCIARRIIGGTDPDDFGIVHRSVFRIADRSSSKILCQGGPAHFHIINMGAHFIHAIGGRMNDHIIFPGITKSTVKKIDTFITAISQKNIRGRKTFYPG